VHGLPHIAIVPHLDRDESLVSINVGDFQNTLLVLDFFEVEDLRRMRGAVDKAEQMLVGRIALDNSLLT
jgi:hypothetical protein